MNDWSTSSGLRRARRPRSAARKRPQREPRVERLGADVVERVVVGRVQPDPPELADVAEPDLAAVVEHQGERARTGPPGTRRRHDEQLAGHLEVDGQERAAVEVQDQHVLAAPPDALDAPAGHPGRRTRPGRRRAASGPTRRARRRSPGRARRPRAAGGAGGRGRRSRPRVAQASPETIGQVRRRRGAAYAPGRHRAEPCIGHAWGSPMRHPDHAAARPRRPHRRQRVVLRERRRCRVASCPASRRSRTRLGLSNARARDWPSPRCRSGGLLAGGLVGLLIARFGSGRRRDRRGRARGDAAARRDRARADSWALLALALPRAGRCSTRRWTPR